MVVLVVGGRGLYTLLDTCMGFLVRCVSPTSKQFRWLNLKCPYPSQNSAKCVHVERQYVLCMDSLPNLLRVTDRPSTFDHSGSTLGCTRD